MIDGKEFSISVSDERLKYLIERTGAQRQLSQGRRKLEIKELSGVDPFTIAIGVGAVITWIVYRVSQSQKEEFRNNFKKGLR